MVYKWGWTNFFKGGPFISAAKGGDQIFQKGTDFFQKILVPPDHFFLKYLVRGGIFGGTNSYVTVMSIYGSMCSCPTVCQTVEKTEFRMEQ